MSITVENNATEALKLARESGDPARIASRKRQVAYWEKFIRELRQ